MSLAELHRARFRTAAEGKERIAHINARIWTAMLLTTTPAGKLVTSLTTRRGGDIGPTQTIKSVLIAPVMHAVGRTDDNNNRWKHYQLTLPSYTLKDGRYPMAILALAFANKVESYRMHLCKVPERAQNAIEGWSYVDDVALKAKLCDACSAIQSKLKAVRQAKVDAIKETL